MERETLITRPAPGAQSQGASANPKALHRVAVPERAAQTSYARLDTEDIDDDAFSRRHRECDEQQDPHSPGVASGLEASKAGDAANGVLLNIRSGGWLPFSMRWPCLVALIAACCALLLATITIYLRSLTHSGLADYNGSRQQIFASRFLPPLFAVTYGVALMILLEDVKRTEPFARLSRRIPPHATATLLTTQGRGGRQLPIASQDEANEDQRVGPCYLRSWHTS